jgi:hypothetical protein
MFCFKSTEKDQRITALEERIKTLEQQNITIIQEMLKICDRYDQHVNLLERQIINLNTMWKSFRMDHNKNEEIPDTNVDSMNECALCEKNECKVKCSNCENKICDECYRVCSNCKNILCTPCGWNGCPGCRK